MASLSLSLLLPFARVESKRETRDRSQEKEQNEIPGRDTNQTKVCRDVRARSKKTIKAHARGFSFEKRPRERERERERERRAHLLFLFCEELSKESSSKKFGTRPKKFCMSLDQLFESMDLTMDGEAITCSCSDF